MIKPPQLTDALGALRQATTARVALGRAGQGLPTAPMLAFQLAHARARDAVHAKMDLSSLRQALGGETVVVESKARDRAAYLQDPDLGRQLQSPETLPSTGPYDLAIVVADGLSSIAVNAHSAQTVQALLSHIKDWSVAPVIIARLARVAIGDPVGLALEARIVVVLIGERPGLSAVDSLGAYITFDPKPGRRDSERNCVSNIRSPHGLSPADAGAKIAWLLMESRRLGFTGVDLKDRQDAGVLIMPPGPILA